MTLPVSLTLLDFSSAEIERLNIVRNFRKTYYKHAFDLTMATITDEMSALELWDALYDLAPRSGHSVSTGNPRYSIDDPINQQQLSICMSGAMGQLALLITPEGGRFPYSQNPGEREAMRAVLDRFTDEPDLEYVVPVHEGIPEFTAFLSPPITGKILRWFYEDLQRTPEYTDPFAAMLTVTNQFTLSPSDAFQRLFQIGMQHARFYGEVITDKLCATAYVCPIAELPVLELYTPRGRVVIMHQNYGSGVEIVLSPNTDEEIQNSFTAERVGGIRAPLSRPDMRTLIELATAPLN